MPERETALRRQRELYESYLGEVELAERNRKPGAGIFGMKGGPADDPCHDRFAERLKAFYDELAAQNAESGTLRQLMAYACTAPLDNNVPRTAYWMLIAVQSLCRPMIARLDAQDASALVELYEKSFRRSERMPVQIKMIKELKAASKA